MASAGRPADTGPTAAVTTAQPPGQPGPALSAAARRVSQIAERNGDRDFLMIDKARGRIIVFEHGAATFSGTALTGQSLGDFIPPDAFGLSFHQTTGLKYKVTPAGRFTVSPGYDKAYGDTLDVNEIRGKDWEVSIHRVWLGAPAEHRDARLLTATGQDKHITYGCVDVTADTMRQLLSRLPNADRIPLYIVPMNENLIAALFQPRDTARLEIGKAVP